MFRWFTAGLFFVTVSAAFAQHQLTMPDLTALTSPGEANISLDRRVGWFYASGRLTRVMGVNVTGLARVSTEGVVDASWRPTGLDPVYSHVVAANGDVYVMGRSGDNVFIAHYSAAPGAALISRRVLDADLRVAGSVPRMLGGQDRWLYLSVNEVGNFGPGSFARVRWSRFDTTTDQMDSQWSLNLVLPSGTDFSTVSMILGADGSIYTSVAKSILGVANNKIVTIARVANDSNASALWTQEFTTERFSMVADAQGRLYVMVCAGSCAARAEVLRFNSAGVVDYTWNRVDASRAVSQSVKPVTLSVVDNELIVGVVLQNSSTTTRAALIRMDVSGVEKARWVANSGGAIGEIFGAREGKLYLRFDSEIRALDATTLRDVAASSFTFGEIGRVSHMLALPDGGYLIFGSFDVWYEGRRFRNALRTRADGLPDLTWTPKLESVTIYQATLTAKGVVVVGDLRLPASQSFNIKAFLVSLAPDAAIDPTWGTDWPRSSTQSYDGSAYFYVLTGEYPINRVLRVSLATGLLDPGWEVLAPLGESDEAFDVKADTAGGVWLLWQDQLQYFTPSLTKIQRFSVVTRQETQRFRPTSMAAFRTTFLTTSEHAYIADRRYDLSNAGALDPTWALAGPSTYVNIELAQIRGRYVYLKKDRLQRALLSGDGAIDASFDPSLIVYDAKNPTSAPVWVQSPREASEEMEFVLTPVKNSALSDGALITTRNPSTPDKTIVEYFNRDAARYFITGRASEQALLDGLPASFQRTGMQFSAKSSVYRDVPEVPICRFYSAPENGGSNTHFYGSGDDCPALNTVAGLRYEGYDFSTIKPINQSCAAGTPNAVSRLFNNQSASNQGNHRYVVSAATKAKMTALGWIDEGVVFCVASVTDAVNVAN